MAVYLIAYDVTQALNEAKDKTIEQRCDALRTEIHKWIVDNFIGKKKGVQLSESSYAVKPASLTQNEIFETIMKKVKRHKLEKHIAFFVIPLVQTPLGHPNGDRLKWLKANLPISLEIVE